MKICFVSAFPPSRVVLNEYGYHVVKELQRDPLLSVTVLGDEFEPSEPELPEFGVERAWKPNRLFNQPKLLKAIRDVKPDVVWLNLLFSTFGDKFHPVAAFSGLTIPALTRLSGYYTHVTLHHLMDHVSLDDTGVRAKWLFKAGGQVATRMLLMSNSISVLLPAYRRTLIEKYRGENVHFRAHGILSARPEYPDFSRRGSPHRILAFGKWGTYKRLEALIEVFEEMTKTRSDLKLICAGGNNPNAHGYVEALSKQYQGHPSIEFTGYVSEDRIPELFSTASVLIMPYTSAAGASGVAHLACEYGVPIVSADIPDFREMAVDEQLAVRFYRTGDDGSMRDAIVQVLDDRQMQSAMAEQNFTAALRMTMPQIIRQYVRTFDLHQRQRALESISRFRRLPSWIPSRSAIFRASAPRLTPWA